MFHVKPFLFSSEAGPGKADHKKLWRKMKGWYIIQAERSKPIYRLGRAKYWEKLSQYLIKRAE
jgi:hypothetical protein